MPKVSDEYTASKRDFILQCMNEVYEEKPLYQITMRDVIKKTGYSQGAIYRYYKNLDEIYLDLINRNTTEFQLEQEIDKILCSGLEETETISKCLLAIGSYMRELLKLSAGKMYFGLLAIYERDAHKREYILPRLKFRKTLAYAQQKTAEYLIQNVQNGALKPTISVEALIAFTSAAVDGISSGAVLNDAGEGGRAPGPAIDILELFQVLAKSIAGFLGATERS